MPSIIDQYRTIVSAAGWIDLSTRGRLRVEGDDAVSFLQALVSNDVSSLKPGEGVYATYLTPQGRMLADLEIYRRPQGVLASVPHGAGASLATRLDQLIFAEDVRVIDESQATVELAIIGGEASSLMGEALDLPPKSLNDLAELAHVAWRDGFVARAGESRLPMFKVLAPIAERSDLIVKLEGRGVVPLTQELAESLRVEAGRPRFGVDMTTEIIPLEAGLLERAISTTKGCYVGQEIIIRVLHRGGGRVAKRLAKFSFGAGDAPPTAGAALQVGGREVGSLTSVARAPSAPGWIALGYLQRDAAEVGTEVTVAGSAIGRVTGLAGSE